MNRKLNQAFGARRAEQDEAAAFISSAETAASKESPYKSNGKEKAAYKTLCISVSLRQEEAIDKLAMVKRKSKAAIVREAIDMYVKRHQKDIDKYDAFFGE